MAVAQAPASDSAQPGFVTGHPVYEDEAPAAASTGQPGGFMSGHPIYEDQPPPPPPAAAPAPPAETMGDRLAT